MARSWSANIQDNCRIATGRYTGDGTVAQAIIGLGFRPMFVRIVQWFDVETVPCGSQFYRSDQNPTDLSEVRSRTEDELEDNRIISLDADGFTVDDNALDNHPNKNGIEYTYVAWG